MLHLLKEDLSDDPWRNITWTMWLSLASENLTAQKSFDKSGNWFITRFRLPTLYYISPNAILMSVTHFILHSNCSSAQKTVSYGVPQGSVLSPVLLLVHMLPLCTQMQMILSVTTPFSLTPVISRWNWKNAYQKSNGSHLTSLFWMLRKLKC